MEENRMLTDRGAEVQQGSGSLSESHWQAGAKATAGMCSVVQGSCVKVYLKGTCGLTVIHGGCKSPFDFTGGTTSNPHQLDLRQPGPWAKRPRSRRQPFSPSYPILSPPSWNPSPLDSPLYSPPPSLSLLHSFSMWSTLLLSAPWHFCLSHKHCFPTAHIITG